MKKCTSALINRDLKIHIKNLEYVYKFTMKTILLLFFALTISCKSQKTTITIENMELLKDGWYSTMDDYGTQIIKTQKELNAFYTKINRSRKGRVSVPKVDFEKEMVLIACMGKQTGMLPPSLSIKDETKKAISVSITSEKDGEGDKTYISSPFCIYKIPQTDKEIEFIKE